MKLQFRISDQLWNYTQAQPLINSLRALSSHGSLHVDFTHIRYGTNGHWLVSIGVPETPTRSASSADNRVMWYYNPSPLLPLLMLQTSGLQGSISHSTLIQHLRQRISSQRGTANGSYPIVPLYHRLVKQSTSVHEQVSAWRGFIATIHCIHARTYYASKLN